LSPFFTVTVGDESNGCLGLYALDVYTSADAESKLWTDADGYLFYENGDLCYLIGYTGNETDLTLPATCNGKNYSIYEYAFYKYREGRLTSVIIPEGVTGIGSYAFNTSTELTSLTLPSGLMSVGVGVVSGCSSLQTIYFSGTEGDWILGIPGTVIHDVEGVAVYFYSETQPTETGDYWHYVDGVPTVW